MASWRGVLLGGLGLGACVPAPAPGSAAAPPVSASPAPPGLGTAASSPTAPAEAAAPSALAEPSVPARQQYLVLTAGGELTVGGASGPRPVLETKVQEASYDAQRELVWLLTETELRVLDLRRRGSPSVPIARGLAYASRLSIAQEGNNLLPDDGCDLPYVQLDWSAEPKVEGVIERMGDPALVGHVWLRAELHRERRDVPLARLSAYDLRGAKARVKLPKQLAHCEDPEDCGTAVPFASWGQELVLVSDQMGGDCWTRTCLLHDPKTDQFASPPVATRWGAAAEAKPGSCGFYQFDAAGESFLTDEAICTRAGCRELGGHAVGWLQPGPIVGMPGIAP